MSWTKVPKRLSQSCTADWSYRFESRGEIEQLQSHGDTRLSNATVVLLMHKD